MNIVYKSLDEIKPYEKNPRHNDEAVEGVKNSIEEFGFKIPIVIDKNGTIVAGHTRYKASKELGLDKVPCIIADDLTSKQIKAFRLADNKTAEKAGWDFGLLNIELEDLKLDFDMSDFGFDLSLDNEEDEKKQAEEDHFDIEDNIPEEPISKVGDIYKLGEHILMCGDATSKEHIDKLMNGKEADMVFTDPPYNVDYEGKTIEKLTIMNDKKGSREFYSFLYDVFENIASVMKAGASIYVCHAHMESINFIASFQASGFYLSQMLIWNKSSMCIGRSDYQWKHEPIMYGWKLGAGHYFTKDRTQTTVWDFDKPSRNGEHPTMKPIALCAKAIENSSHKGDIVLDVFGGSGSTLMACEQLNRKCRMMELDPKYCDVIIKRWEEFTGNKAEKLN